MPSLPSSATLTLQNSRLSLGGNWSTTDLSGVIPQIEQFCTTPPSQVKELDASGILSLDTNGALCLLDLESALHIEVTGLMEEGQNILSLIKKNIPPSISPPPITGNIIIRSMEKLGKRTLESLVSFKAILIFLGKFVVTAGTILTGRYPLNLRSISAIIFQVGVTALPIVGLISFLIGVVLAYQGVTQLSRFGAQVFTVNLLAVGILREVGILLTAVVVAGRSGSAFTAQIGIMNINQEVDALRVMGLDPLGVLVWPRVVALVFALPLLTVFSDLIGLLGGAFMCKILLDLPYIQYISQLKSAIELTTFWIGVIKAPVFGFWISLVACFEGFRVRGGAESVGTQTTKSVVEGIFLVIIFDAVFSIIFSYLDL